MSEETNKPVIFLAFANDRDDKVGYLRNLPDEARRLRDLLAAAEQAGLCEVVVRSNCTAGDIFNVFQDPRYRNRIAIFHYGGHANGYQLLLESAAGQAAAADAGGLAAFLAQQQGLQLVFLNGCSTQQQTQGLLDANISTVISTSRSIDDRVATDFACGFYQGLAGGASIRTTYSEAEAAAKTAKGGNTRDLYFGDPSDLQSKLEADRWPWNLYLREGSESADQWNLPDAVNDPLFGLPPLPEQDLPESPYRHLNWFTRRDAEVFFGRGHQIREMYERLTAGTQPIILFYGQSGVGKSSLLEAGLLPRLEQNYEVRYSRRGDNGLLADLRSELMPAADDAPIETAWRVKEQCLGKPLIVFLDQVEEFYTRPIVDMPDELDQLLQVVKAIFSDPTRRPKGKLVLGFREEWLAKLETHVKDYQLPRTKVFLQPLDRRGIVEVIEGPTHTRRLLERYALTVEPGLAEEIANDLLADRGSAISTTLQILLSKMWEKATESNSEPPQFSRDLYLDLKSKGILLGDFLDQQLQAFHAHLPGPSDSGLLLELLAQHTTSLGTADQLSRERLLAKYSHVSDLLPDLLQQCQDLYLLTMVAGTQKESPQETRLAHDALAPLVRERFEQSDRPGRRARRILDAKSHEWDLETVGDNPPGGVQRELNDKNLLNDMDLKIVEEGISGTWQWNETERGLVDASRVARATRRRKAKIAFYTAVLVTIAIGILAGLASWQWRVAAIARRSYLEQKNWSGQRIDFYETRMRKIQQQVTKIREVTSRELAAPSMQTVEEALAAVQSVTDTYREMTLPSGELVPIVRVHFMTTRAMEPTGAYGYRRNVEGPEYGYCDVSMPPGHARGKVESPVAGEIEDSSRHVKIQFRQSSTDQEFRQQLASWDEPNRRRVLVFIHGYNMTFDTAVRRASQLALDIRFEGELVLFSWASRGSPTAYVRDEEQLAFAEPDFVQLLDQLSEVFDERDIDILGHSLGARLVAKGCTQWLNQAAPDRRLGQVVLTAADIDVEYFYVVLADRLAAGASRVTLYVAPGDNAFAAARMHKGPRVGAEIVERASVDTIEVLVSQGDLIGHSYYATSSAMLDDLGQLLQGVTAPKRRGLQMIGGHYKLKQE